jgi:peptidoglycan-associated lipoprotein
MLKKYLPFFAFSLVLALTACGKKKVAGDGSGAYGSGEGFESIPLPGDRPNPDSANYSTLASYTVYFGFDSYSIDPSERGKLDQTATWLSNNPGKKIFLAGHTDSRGTVEYNLSLGERRALAMRDYLLGLGVDSSRLYTISYGEERPADGSENDSAWAKNRRVQAGVLP